MAPEFQDQGGTGGATHLIGDNIVGLFGGAWRSAYLGTDGRWYLRGSSILLNGSVVPGGGYYYFRRGTNISWTAKEQ